MLIKASRLKQNSIALIGLIFGCWLLYSGLDLFSPGGTTPRVNYHLPPGGLNALRLTFLIPILVFWLIAIYGASSFSDYAGLISKSPEERPLKTVSIALYLTLAYFVVGAIFSSLLNFYTRSPGYGALIVLHDHLSAIITLAAFAFFYAGSRELCQVSGLRLQTRSRYVVAGIAILFAIAFSTRFLTMPVTPVSAAGSSLAYVSRPMLLMTMILPYLVAWTLGALSVTHIVTYTRNVHGILYRSALKNLAWGLCFVIGFTVLGGILMLASSTISIMTLGPILLILYFALLLYGIGYVFVALGAGKLTKIEIATAPE